MASDLVRPGLVAEDNEDVEVQLAQPDFDSSDPYSVLGVPEEATIHQIKMTYHKLSKQYHPDRLPRFQTRKMRTPHLRQSQTPTRF